MKVGIVLPQTGQQATKDNVVELAQKSEKEGFDSLWVFDRLLWPVGATEHHIEERQMEVYQMICKMYLILLGTLAFVAANTEKIALGTCVIDMLFHNPVILARRFATLDVLSEGRDLWALVLVGQKTSTSFPTSHLNTRGKKGK